MLMHHDQNLLTDSTSARLAKMLMTLTLVVGIGILASPSQGEDKAAADAGLQGILPQEAPDDLGFEAWEQLDGNWTSWSEEVAELVGQLYEDELDLKQQRELLQSLGKKLTVMQTALDDPRYASLHTPLQSLHNRLSRRVELATAILDTVTLKPSELQAAALKSSGAQLGTALQELEDDLNSIPQGTAWLSYVKFKDLTAIAQKASADDAAQQALKTVRKRLESTNELNEDQQKFLARGAFQALAKSIAAYQSVLSESYEEADPQALRAQLKILANALESYEQNAGRQSAEQARAALTTLKTLASDKGHRLNQVVQDRYTNFNLRVIASESFLNRVVYTKRTEKGDINDYILGANVAGEQTTTAHIGIDLKNSANGALFDITLSGVVRSNTQGVTDKATIYTSGNHRFEAAKPVFFDGQTLAGRKSTISVDANNTTTGASTEASGIPLFGQIAEGIAKNVARQRRGQSEAITESRITDNVLPRFNEEVDRDITKANEVLKDKVLAKLKESKLAPTRQQISTTDTQFNLHSLIMGAGELGGTALPNSKIAKNTMALQLHESLINNALNHLQLAGKTMTEQELQAEFQRGLSQITGREVELKSKSDTDADADSGPNTYVFDAHDPIRVRFSDGQVILVLRAGFRQEGKEDIPPQQVTVPLQFVVKDGKIVATRGTVKVSPVVRPKNLQIQIARAGVIRKKLERALPKREFDANMAWERKEDPTLEIGLVEIQSRDGWLTINVK